MRVWRAAPIPGPRKPLWHVMGLGLLSGLGIADGLALLTGLGGCQRERPPMKTLPLGARATGSVASALPSGSGSAGSFLTKLKHETLSMQLPQPISEPVDDRLRTPTPSSPLPPDTHVVLGSEVVQSTRDPNRRGTLVNVWASWCESCEAEMPMLAKLAKRYETRGIELVFVSVDAPEQAQAARSSLARRGIAGPTYLAHPELGYFKQALSPIWKGSLPATFLYDNTGRLRYFWGAEAYEEEVAPILDGFLNGEAIDGLANFRVKGGTAVDSDPEP